MIEVEHDGTEEREPDEACCFCRVSTKYWYQPKDVACCPKCARVAEDKDVPSKKLWCRREHIVYQSRRI